MKKLLNSRSNPSSTSLWQASTTKKQNEKNEQEYKKRFLARKKKRLSIREIGSEGNAEEMLVNRKRISSRTPTRAQMGSGSSLKARA